MYADRPDRAPAARSPRVPGLARTSAVLLAALALAGCTLTPDGADEEAARLADAGRPYEPPFESRAVPDLPDAPDWQDVLRRALLANGEVEAAYFRWKAAVERVDIAGAYPNSPVSLGFEYMFSGERLKSFDRSTFTAGFDPSMSLSLPVKVRQAAKVALDDARAAGEQFRVAKFDVQRDVLQAWADYVLQGQVLALRQQDLALRKVMLEAARGGARAGGRVREALAADLELQTDQGMLADLSSEHESTRVRLNAMMGRPPAAPLPVPATLPAPRSLPDDDLVMVKAAADMFPEVAVLAREVEGRTDALELARLRWLPDLSPTLGFTGSVAQTLGLMVTLPTTVSAIRGEIREAQAGLRASQAMLRQRASDRVGEYFTLVLMYKNARRQAVLFEGTLIPAATRLSDDQLRAYEAGAATFADVVESRRALLGLREVVATSRAQMDKALVEIECCLGVDIERLPTTPASPTPDSPNPPSPSTPPAPVAAAPETRHEH